MHKAKAASDGSTGRPSNPTTGLGSGRAGRDYSISIGFWQPSGAPAHIQRGRLFFVWAQSPVDHAGQATAGLTYTSLAKASP